MKYFTKQAMLKSMTQEELLQRAKDRRRELVAKRKAKRLNKLKRRTDIYKDK